MRKTIFFILLMVATGVNAMPTLSSRTILLTNIGSQKLYYALADTSSAGGNTLCATVNGLTVKEEVQGEILAGESETLVLTPIETYATLCSSYTFSYIFAFGITEDGALYNMNPVALYQTFNDNKNYSGNIPLSWGYDRVMQQTGTIGEPLVNAGGALQFNINSDNSEFVY